MAWTVARLLVNHFACCDGARCRVDVQYPEIVRSQVRYYNHRTGRIGMRAVRMRLLLPPFNRTEGRPRAHHRNRLDRIGVELPGRFDGCAVNVRALVVGRDELRRVCRCQECGMARPESACKVSIRQFSIVPCAKVVGIDTAPVERVSKVSRDPSSAIRKLVTVPCSGPHSSADHMYRPVRKLVSISQCRVRARLRTVGRERQPCRRLSALKVVGLPQPFLRRASRVKVELEDLALVAAGKQPIAGHLVRESEAATGVRGGARKDRQRRRWGGGKRTASSVR
jgi:hypothetical protein